jgi:hypothetical protein
MTPAQLEQMAHEAGLLHGPAADDRAKLMLAALGVFAKLIRARALEEAEKLVDTHWRRHQVEIVEAIRALAKQEGVDKP